jgi:Phage integrase family
MQWFTWSCINSSLRSETTSNPRYAEPRILTHINPDPGRRPLSEPPLPTLSSPPLSPPFGYEGYCGDVKRNLHAPPNVLSRKPQARGSGISCSHESKSKSTLPLALSRLNDIAILMLETGLRVGEALHLEWKEIRLTPVNGARFGFLRVREGKSKNGRRVIPLTDGAAAMRRERERSKSSGFVFANREGKPYLGTSINHLHRDAIAPKVEGERRPILQGDFVLHSIRHTMFTRLGESGVDAFTIMRIAGHSSIVVSQRYILRQRRQWSVLSSGFNFPARLPRKSRNDCHPLRYPLQLLGGQL